MASQESAGRKGRFTDSTNSKKKLRAAPLLASAWITKALCGRGVNRRFSNLQPRSFGFLPSSRDRASNPSAGLG